LELKRRKYKYVKGFLLWKDNCKFYLSLQMHNYRFFQPICIAEVIFVPEMSFWNLDKIATVYPKSRAFPARFYSTWKLRIGWCNMQYFGGILKL
jgi:hypothetical protein